MTEELHVVDVEHRMQTSNHGPDYGVWLVRLSDGKAMLLGDYHHPDELSVYVYATNRLKEQANGTNSRA